MHRFFNFQIKSLEIERGNWLFLYYNFGLDNLVFIVVWLIKNKSLGKNGKRLNSLEIWSSQKFVYLRYGT